MKGLITLVAMQLKDKLDFGWKHTTKGRIFKIVLTTLKYLLITLIIYFVFYMLSVLRLVSLLPGMPQNVLLVLFTAMMMLSILVATISIMRSLYFAKDNALLLTFPVARSTVFSSKLIVFYLYELIRNSTYLLPLLVAFGAINSIHWTFYVWLVPAFLLLTAVPVAIGALLSIPLMAVTNFVRQHKWLQYAVVSVGVVGSVWLLIIVINALPTDIDLIGTWGTTFWQIQTWLSNFTVRFALFDYLLIGIVGQQYGLATTIFGSTQLIVIAVIIVGIAVIMSITYMLVRPLFFHMASSPFEYRKVEVGGVHSNKRHNVRMSILVKEFKMLLRTTDRLVGLLGVAIGAPLAILLLNQIYSAIDMRLDGQHMAMAFNTVIILLLAMSTNIDLAHLYSQDGASIYLNKTAPQPYYTILVTKLVPYTVVMTMSILASCAVYASYAEYGLVEMLTMFGTLWLAYLAHAVMSVESDIMNPQTSHYATTGTHVNNPNDVRSGVYSYIMALAVAGWAYFLIADNFLDAIWLKMMLITMVFFAFRLWVYISKIRVYYKEK